MDPMSQTPFLNAETVDDMCTIVIHWAGEVDTTTPVTVTDPVYGAFVAQATVPDFGMRA